MKTKSYCRAQIRSASFNEDANTIDIVWTTGAAVRRYDWDGTEYDEVLSLEPGAVRLGRLNSGAPFLDTHASDALGNVIGKVVEGSAKIEDGRGVATVKLSSARADADTITKIREGVISNISVGYWIHKIEKTESDDGKVARWDVVDWEPLEVSAVPIPADPGARIRSANGRRRSKHCQSPMQRGAAEATRLLQSTQTRAEAHGAAEARKAGIASTIGKGAGVAFDQAAIQRGARAEGVADFPKRGTHVVPNLSL